MIYEPITILSENEKGQIGTEDWDSLTEEALRDRFKELQKKGWEPQVVMVGEDQHDLPLSEWYHLLED